MTGPATHAATGASAALLGTALLEALGPMAVPTLIFGALGGLTRWLASMIAPDGLKWYRGLIAVPLGAAFALGVASIAGPFIAQWASGGENDAWFRDVLSAPESRSGIAYVLGLFASEIVNKVSRNFKEGK